MLTIITGKSCYKAVLWNQHSCYSVFVTRFTDVVMDKQLPLMWDENNLKWQLKGSRP